MPFLSVTDSSFLMGETAKDNRNNPSFALSQQVRVLSASFICFRVRRKWTVGFIFDAPEEEKWYNDMLFWNGTHPLSPWEHGCSVTSVPGHKQQGHNPVEEFTASSMSIHPHQCPFLTVLLWSFFSPVILIYVCRLLEASYSERIQTRRTQDLFPLRLLLQAHRVPKHHKSPITTEQSYSGTFARGISGRLLSLICICWYVFPDPVIESFLFLSVSVVLLYYVSSLRSLRNPWALIFNLYKWEVTEAALEWEK